MASRVIMRNVMSASETDKGQLRGTVIKRKPKLSVTSLVFTAPTAHDPEKSFKRRLRSASIQTESFTVNTLELPLIVNQRSAVFARAPYHHVLQKEKTFQDMLGPLRILIYEATAIWLVRRFLQSAMTINDRLERLH